MEGLIQLVAKKLGVSLASNDQSSSGEKPRAQPFQTYAFGYVFALLAVAPCVLKSSTLAMFGVPVFAFVCVPFLDALFGTDTFNPDEDAWLELTSDTKYSFITCLWLPYQILLVTLTLFAIKNEGDEMSTGRYAGLIISVGLTCGIVGITFAHELMHKTTSKLEVFCSLGIMSLLTYPHYVVEHVWGHHKHVATPLDPATSRLGESLFAFLPRTIIGGFLSAWGIEATRMAKINQGTFSTNNKILRYAVIVILEYAVVYHFFGLAGAGFFLGYGFVAVTTLEVVNYLEHYGLQRKELSPGVYEQVRPKHSWNSGARISNYLLINLARHSDHHTNSFKRYQLLRNEQELAPQLPFGYGTMFIMALYPPYWRSVMDPLVIEWNAKVAEEDKQTEMKTKSEAKKVK